MSTWEERMSERVKARMVVAEAEQIARQAVEPEPEPPRCVACGNILTLMLGPAADDGPWCVFCDPHALVWDDRTQSFKPQGETPDLR